MSLASILSSATSGLAASQAQIRVASSNVANVNTPGYARAQVELANRVVDGVGAGVDIAAVKRATDVFLQRAMLASQGDKAAAAALNSLWSQLSPYLGTTDKQGAIVSRLNAVTEAFSAASADPASSLRRAQVVTVTQNLLSEISNMADAVSGLRAQADTQIGQNVARANDLLEQIARLNSEISRTGAAGGDSSGSENQQAALIDELSGILSIRADRRDGGGVVVRTTDGITLADGEAGSLSYNPLGQGGAATRYDSIILHPPHGAQAQALEAHIDSGSIAGLLHARDGDMLDMQRSLGELAGGVADSLNRAHNASSSYPAPASMTGRNTGLLAGDSLGFSGKTTIALVNPDGTLANRIDVDFTLGTISLNGGATAPIGTTIGSFATALNGVLTGATLGTASFTNGKLAINATGGPGIVIQDNAATPASRGGRGFSQFFGMNDLITSDAPTFYETGLSAADAHGLGAGSFMFEIRDAQGRATGTKTIAVSGATIGDILSSLNNSATGLGLYAQFTLDSNGKIVQTPAPGADAYSVNLVGDNTQRGATGLTFSKIMGLGDSAKAGRADDIALNAQIVANPTKLAFAHADLAGAVTGARVLVSGDARGATALTAAFETTRAFGAAGGLSAMNISVGSFTSQMLGLAGSRAKRAEEAETSATDLNAEVAQRRSAVEGVNLDEELANLTLYQQAYNASARLIAAAQDMMDTLLAIAR